MRWSNVQAERARSRGKRTALCCAPFISLASRLARPEPAPANRAWCHKDKRGKLRPNGAAAEAAEQRDCRAKSQNYRHDNRMGQWTLFGNKRGYVAAEKREGHAQHDAQKHEGE